MVCVACGQRIRAVNPVVPRMGVSSVVAVCCPKCGTPLTAPATMRGKVVECTSCNQKIRLARESYVQENPPCNIDKPYDQALKSIQTEYAETLQTIVEDHAEALSNIRGGLEDRHSELDDKLEEMDSLCNEMRDAIEEREGADEDHVDPQYHSVWPSKGSIETAKRNMHMRKQDVVCPTCKEHFSISYGIGEVENERKAQNEAAGCMAALGTLFFWPLLAGAAYGATRKPRRTVLCRFCGRVFEVSLQ